MDKGASVGPGSCEPSPVVSALTGFDPSRKEDTFKIQLDATKRADAFDAATKAERAIQWLQQYGSAVLAGGTYGKDLGDYRAAESYVKEALEVHASTMLLWALEDARGDLERCYAIATEARKGGDACGSVHEGAAPTGIAQSEGTSNVP